MSTNLVNLNKQPLFRLANFHTSPKQFQMAPERTIHASGSMSNETILMENQLKNAPNCAVNWIDAVRICVSVRCAPQLKWREICGVIPFRQ